MALGVPPLPRRLDGQQEILRLKVRAWSQSFRKVSDLIMSAAGSPLRSARNRSFVIDGPVEDRAKLCTISPSAFVQAPSLPER